MPGGRIERGSSYSSVTNEIPDKFKPILMDAVKATISEISSKSKEDISSMMDLAVETFHNSKKSVVTDASNVLTELDKVEDRKRKLEVETDSFSDEEKKKKRSSSSDIFP